MSDQPAYFIDGADVDAALGTAGRVYLAGHLQRPQPGFEHIAVPDNPVEVGITRYDKLTVDQPHLHEVNTDFTLVVRGTYAVRIMSTGEVRELTEGGFNVIEPGIPHICIAHADTQVLFFKLPGGNDKHVLEPDADTKRWIGEYCAQFC